MAAENGGLCDSTRFSPPPPEGFISPMTWGIEANVIELCASAV
jgi:hypothetical protein